MFKAQTREVCVFCFLRVGVELDQILVARASLCTSPRGMTAGLVIGLADPIRRSCALYRSDTLRILQVLV